MHTIGNMASVSTWLNWQCNHWLHVQCTLFAPWLLQPIGYMGNAHNWQNGHCFLYGNIAIATNWLHGQCTKLATWSVLPHGLHGQCNKLVTWPIHTNVHMAIATKWLLGQCTTNALSWLHEQCHTLLLSLPIAHGIMFLQ